MDSRAHWERIFTSSSPLEVSWYQPHLRLSLDLIAKAGLGPTARLIDVGAGSSTLVDDLLDQGCSHLTVLDISLAALHNSRVRLGPRSRAVHWVEADILNAPFRAASLGLWHDRAVFHFLTRPEQRQAYIRQAGRVLRTGGCLVLSTFGLEGPPACSGLPTDRYGPEELALQFGAGFELLESRPEIHHTPSGREQKFNYFLLQRTLAP